LTLVTHFAIKRYSKEIVLMIKKLVCFAALCVSITGVAQAKDYRLTAEDLRLSKDSTVISIKDVEVCFNVYKQLTNDDNIRRGNYKKYKTYYPHLYIPVVGEHLYTRSESMDLMRLKYRLSGIVYNPKNNNYMYLQCMPFLGGDIKWPQEMFAETLTIEQVQQEIDLYYAEYLSKKNTQDSEVNRILGK
jgi:hypothetical protein